MCRGRRVYGKSLQLLLNMPVPKTAPKNKAYYNRTCLVKNKTNQPTLLSLPGLIKHFHEKCKSRQFRIVTVFLYTFLVQQSLMLFVNCIGLCLPTIRQDHIAWCHFDGWAFVTNFGQWSVTGSQVCHIPCGTEANHI